MKWGIYQGLLLCVGHKARSFFAIMDQVNVYAKRALTNAHHAYQVISTNEHLCKAVKATPLLLARLLAIRDTQQALTLVAILLLSLFIFSQVIRVGRLLVKLVLFIIQLALVFLVLAVALEYREEFFALVDEVLNVKPQ